MRNARLLVLLVLLPMCLRSVAADDGLRSLRIQLQWLPQAQFAGYYAAQALGFYAEEGLDVTLLPSRGDIQPVAAVLNGDADFGVGWLPKLLIANQADADLVNIAQVFQRSGTVLVSFAETGIQTANDIVLKRIGFWDDDNEFEVYALTFHIGSDPVSGEHLMLVPQPFNLSGLLAGEVDAAQALIYNSYGALLGEVNPATGELFQPQEFNLIDMNELGVAMLQDQLFTRRDWLAQTGGQTIALGLLRATLRGWIHCRDQADDCVRILLEVDPALGESHQQWQMNEVNKLIWPAPAGIGALDAGLYQQTVDWLLRIGTLDEAPPPDTYRSDLLLLALDALQLDGLDVTGESWQPAKVLVRAGGG